MGKTKAKRFWQEVWGRYVEKQKYTKGGIPKKGRGYESDSDMVSNAIWCMLDKEFEEIIKKVGDKQNGKKL